MFNDRPVVIYQDLCDLLRPYIQVGKKNIHHLSVSGGLKKLMVRKDYDVYVNLQDELHDYLLSLQKDFAVRGVALEVNGSPFLNVEFGKSLWRYYCGRDCKNYVALSRFVDLIPESHFGDNLRVIDLDCPQSAESIGVYNVERGRIRLKDSLVTSLEVFAGLLHEFGHSFDHKLGLIAEFKGPRFKVFYPKIGEVFRKAWEYYASLYRGRSYSGVSEGCFVGDFGRFSRSRPECVSEDVSEFFSEFYKWFVMDADGKNGLRNYIEGFSRFENAHDMQRVWGLAYFSLKRFFGYEFRGSFPNIVTF